jgi:hypothetical protein
MKKSNKIMSITHHLLLAQFSYRVLIPVDELAGPYLGLSIATAKRKAKMNELPFPAFKVEGSQKSPFVVHLHDLVRFIDKRTIEAENLWNEYQYKMAS